VLSQLCSACCVLGARCGFCVNRVNIGIIVDSPRSAHGLAPACWSSSLVAGRVCGGGGSENGEWMPEG
jgi:hypothetical protein